MIGLAVFVMRDGEELGPTTPYGVAVSNSVRGSSHPPPAASAGMLVQVPRPAPSASAADKCARVFDLSTASDTQPAPDAAALAAHNRMLSLLRARGDDLSLALTHVGDESNTAARTGELARLAQRSRDPTVIVLALNTCRAEPHADCNRLTAEQWQRRDPESAWPWLQIAADAFARGDEQTADAALQRSVAASWSGSGASLEPLFTLPSEDDESLVEKWGAISMALAAHELVQGMIGPVVVGCRNVHVGEGRSAKRSLSAALAGCRALAEKLSVGSTRMERFGAYAIGEAVGWPPERVAATRAEMHVLQEFVIGGPPQKEDCDGIRAQLTISREDLFEGEFPAAQRRMKAAGVTLEQLVAQRRVKDASQASLAVQRASAPR